MPPAKSTAKKSAKGKRAKPASTRKAPAVRKPATVRKPAAVAKRKAAARKPARKRAAKRSAPATGDLHALEARVIGIFGKRGERVLLELPTEFAEQLFPDGLIASGRTDVITGAERDVGEIKKRDKALGESALARAVVALAYEIAHPYNSATSKSMCTRELRESLDRLRELAPEKEEADQLDDLSARRATRIAGA